MRRLPRDRICLVCLSRDCVHLDPAPPILPPFLIRIIILMARGLGNQDIANEADISLAYANKCCFEIYRKMRPYGVSNRLQAALWARDHMDLLLDRIPPGDAPPIRPAMDRRSFVI